MKSTKYLLLIIGILGAIASLIRIVQGDPVSDVIMGFISSLALFYGYFAFDRLEKKKEK
jgi:uncharacterized MnhB-related membrane protein